MKSLWNNKGLNLGLQKSQPAPVDDGYLHSPSPYQPNASPTFSAASPLSTSFRGQTPSPQKHTFDDSGMNAFDSMDLPFSPAKQANSKSSARNHDYKRFNGSISSGQDATMHPDLSTTSSAEPSPGALSLFGNSQGRSRHGSERSNASSHTTYPGEDMLMEILSSQAIVISFGLKSISSGADSLARLSLASSRSSAGTILKASSRSVLSSLTLHYQSSSDPTGASIRPESHYSSAV